MAVRLKFFRPEHGRDEIRAERDGNDSEYEVFHKSKPLAAARVKQKRREKCDRNSDVNHVQHNFIQTGKRHHGQSRDDAPNLFNFG
jgi:hypothetical protein